MKFFILFVLMFSFTIYSQTNDWKISGQIQARSELDGRDFSNKTYPLTFASIRARVGVEKTLIDKLTFLIQLQDSRVLGQEANPNSDIHNTDMHQGYFILSNLFDVPVYLQAGRFEMKYGTERFIGISNWSYTGRAWDGVRIGYNGRVKIDAFSLTHTESVSYISSASPSVYPYPAIANQSYSIYGLWLNTLIGTSGNIEFVTFYEANRKKTNEENADIKRATSGITYFGNYGKFTTVFESGVQFGKLKDKDLFAYLVSLQLYYNLQQIKLGLSADILSGTKPNSKKISTYETTFGTNHKFYGYMDYFTNFPSHTKNLGLNDFYISGEWQEKTIPGM